MPAYNEAKHIVSNLFETVKTLHDSGYDFEVIVVDDGSSDETYLESAKLLAHHPSLVRVVHYDKNRGKGNALTCGARYATGQHVVFLDADMDLHPRQLPVLLETMKRFNSHIVIGSKRHRGSKVRYYPMHRRLYSSLYFFLVKVLFQLPISDTQTGLKLFNTRALRHVLPFVRAKRFAFDIELLALAHELGYKIVQAPVTLDFRRGMGRLKARDLCETLIGTFAIFYRVKIRKLYAESAKSDAELHCMEYASEVKLPQP